MKGRISLLIAAAVVLAGSAATSVQAASSTVVMSNLNSPSGLDVGPEGTRCASAVRPLTVVTHASRTTRQDQRSGYGAQPTAPARATPSIHPTQPTGELTP